MWFGTEDGLNKYDGYRFTVYRSNPNDKNSISGNSITVLYEDKAGNLWIGTKEGLNRYNRINNTFTKYYADSNDSNTLTNASSFSFGIAVRRPNSCDRILFFTKLVILD